MLKLAFDVTSSDRTTALSLTGEGPKVSYGSPEAFGPLDVRAGELARVTYDPVGKLSLQIHRAVVDEPSARKVLSTLAGILDGRTLPQAPSRAAMCKEVSQLKFDADAPQAINDRYFWHYAIASGAGAVPFEKRRRALPVHGLGRDHGKGHVMQGEFVGEIGEAVALKAFADGITGLAERPQNVLVCREVELPRQGGMVGPFTIKHPIIVESGNHEGDGMRRLKRILRHAPDHLTFDMYAALAEFSVRFDQWKAAPFQFAFRMQTHDVNAENVEFIKTDAVAHDVTLDVRCVGGRTKYKIAYDGDVLNGSDAQKLERGFLASLKLQGS